MTTKVTIYAHAGWPVKVIPMANGMPAGEAVRVEPNEVRDFYVHSGQDLLVHEVQPVENEVKTGDAEPLLQFFAYAHLPPHLQNVSRAFGLLAQQMVSTLPRNPERTVGLRKLLEAKDCAVRAVLFK